MPELKSLAGGEVLYRSWLSPDPKAVIILVHGMGAHTARWNFLADFFTPKGFSLYALELKGFGATPDRPQGHIDSFATYHNDIKQLQQFAAAANPGLKIFLLSESMGSLISYTLVADNPGLFAGNIMISPAFANGMKFSLRAYLDTFTSLLYNPEKQQLMPFTAAMCTRDLDYQKKMNADPREIRVATAKLLLNILLEQIRAKSLTPRTPTLFLISGKDYLVDESAGRKLFAKIKLADKKLIEYPEMLHALSIDLGRENVFTDIWEWLQGRF